jgi:hypothetical protein
MHAVKSGGTGTASRSVAAGPDVDATSIAIQWFSVAFVIGDPLTTAASFAGTPEPPPQAERKTAQATPATIAGLKRRGRLKRRGL